MGTNVVAADPSMCGTSLCPDQVTEGCGGTRGRFKVYEVKSAKPTKLEFTASLTVVRNYLCVFLWIPQFKRGFHYPEMKSIEVNT